MDTGAEGGEQAVRPRVSAPHPSALLLLQWASKLLLLLLQRGAAARACPTS